jgi:uroporphyrinogen-III decarboxylase
VLYHSDGNYGSVIPQLMACGVDGFYCLEPACGMDIVECRKSWPQMVWSGGVDGVELMERGTPRQVKEEVHRQIVETGVLSEGGVFIASSSEINPTIPPANFRAMVDAVGEHPNPDFA